MENQNASSTETARQLSFGEKAVGISFNPGKNQTVEDVKRMQANYIDFLNNLRTQSDNSEVKRMLSVAITEAQSSQMWAVKAATWQY